MGRFGVDDVRVEGGGAIRGGRRSQLELVQSPSLLSFPPQTAMSLQTHPTLQTVLPPTRRRFLRPTEHVWKVSHPTGEDTTAAYDSRAVRKGRLPLRLHRHTSLPDSHEQPIPIRVRYEHDHKHLKKKLHRDISFWVAMSFWWGSAVWVVSPAFAPVSQRQTTSASSN